MKQQDTWPAYHGYGGSFELDVSKYFDILGQCHPDSGRDCNESPFDLLLDLGANTGYYVEKFTVRNFAKNYILVDGKQGAVDLLNERWGNSEWRSRWFSEQVRLKDGTAMPEFEVITAALGNNSGGMINFCKTEIMETEETMKGGCEVQVSSVDDVVGKMLTPAFREHVRKAESAFIKIDTEGMDELVLRGMKGLLKEERGKYKDGSRRFLVNFLQFEFAPYLMQQAKDRDEYQHYDIETVTKYLESMGFESFLIGPRFLPMSHGSWDDEFKTFTRDPMNNAGVRLNYPDFDDRVCAWCSTMSGPSFTADVFAMRSSHPRAAEMKVALGACKESVDFRMKDPQYSYHFEEPGMPL